jgi:hypothetical protein
MQGEGMFLFAAPLDFKELNERIDALDDMVGKAEQGEVVRWRNLWALVDVVHSAFKKVRYPFREEREKAWSRFASIRKRAHVVSSRERENRKKTSQPLYEHIVQLIEASRVEEGRLRLNEMKIRGQKLNEARQLLHDRKGDMLAEHKRVCFGRIRDIQKAHDAWWAHFREERHQRQAEYEKHLDEIGANLDATRQKYDIACSTLAELRKKADKIIGRLHLDRQSEWTANAAEQISKVEAEIAKLEHDVREYEELIRRAEQQLASRRKDTATSESANVVSEVSDEAPV